MGKAGNQKKAVEVGWGGGCIVSCPFRGGVLAGVRARQQNKGLLLRHEVGKEGLGGSHRKRWQRDGDGEAPWA